MRSDLARRERDAHLRAHSVLSLLNGPGSLTTKLGHLRATTSSRSFEQIRSPRTRAALRGWLADIAVRLARWFLRGARLMRVLDRDRAPHDTTPGAVEAPTGNPDQRVEVVLVHWRPPYDRWERVHQVDVADNGMTGAGGVEVGVRSLPGPLQGPPRRRRCGHSRTRRRAGRRCGR